jgi:hypothetical protein
VIDGVPWTASAVGVQTTGGALVLAGTDAGGQTTVGVTTFGTVGTNSVTAGGVVIGQLRTPAGTWQATGGAGSGTVTVTSYTATGAAGTFSFTLPALTGGATGTRTITNGIFSVTF